MRFLLSVTFLMLVYDTLALAQRSLGYWVIGPGQAGFTPKRPDGPTPPAKELGALPARTDFAIQMCGGGELRLGKGVAAGVEAGAIGPQNGFTNYVTAVASGNGYYHFRPSRDVRFDPFVTAGYSALFRRGTVNAVNFGGGLNYWFANSAAIRVEFRDHYVSQQASDPSRPGFHMWGIRVGMSFTSLSP